MDNEQRIEQFRKLIDQDPTNDMAWFSLGGALNQAARPDEAAEAFARCAQANADMSKAYQLAGEAYIAAKKPVKAAEILSKGFVAATERGDRMPSDAMGTLLDSLGVARPPTKAAQATAELPITEGFTCHASGKPGTKLTRPPFRGPIGEWIQTNISKQTFDEWIGLGTKIINELRLDLSQGEQEAVYDHAMFRFIKLSDATYRQLTGTEPPEPAGPYAEAINMILGRMEDVEQFGGDLHQSLGG